MKIYGMKALWAGDDNVYKNLRPLEPEKWGTESLEKQKRGEPLDMTWATDAEYKKISDFIMFPGAGLATTTELIGKLRPFAPMNIVNAIRINDIDSQYALLQATNHVGDDRNMPHIFMMFRQYKDLLVTQKFKDEWERMGLTGAVFQEVTEMDEDRFIAVNFS